MIISWYSHTSSHSSLQKTAIMSCSVQVTAIHVLSGLLKPLQSAGILSLLVAKMQQEFAAPRTADEVRSI